MHGMQMVDVSWVTSTLTVKQLAQALDFAARCAAVTVSRPGADPANARGVPLAKLDENPHRRRSSGTRGGRLTRKQ